MPVHLVRRRDFVRGVGAVAVMAAGAPKLFADEREFGVRRVSGLAVSGRTFPAVAAASMPENLVIGDPAQCIPMRGPTGLQESLAQTGYLELRRYRFDCEEDRVRAREVFMRSGIQTLLTGETGDFLFGFATLAGREKAWRELNSPQWLQLRVQLGDLSIYRVPE